VIHLNIKAIEIYNRENVVKIRITIPIPIRIPIRITIQITIPIKKEYESKTKNK